MHASSKGRNYGLFKTDINLEKYIINLNGSLFYSMIRFRTANHKLPIETGRWNNTDLSERKCISAQEMTLVMSIITSYTVPSLKKKDAPILTHIFYTSSNTLKFKELHRITDKKTQ